MKKRILAMVFVLIMTIILNGCSKPTTPAVEAETQITEEKEEAGENDEIKEIVKASDNDQVFRYSSASAVIGLNPLINTTAPDNGAQSIFLETLVRESSDENGNTIIEPGMADKWEMSDDGLTYTFHIRDGAKWSDGVDVKAQDFEYTFRMMANPTTGSTNAWLFDGVIKNFTQALYNDGNSPDYNMKPEDIGVKAFDDKTVEYTLEMPYSYFLQLLTGSKPVRQDAYEKYGDAYGSSPDKVVTNGPFKIESWDQNVQMTLVKNENYWNAENVALQRIERRVIGQTQTAVQALLSGQIDVVGTNDPNWQKAIQDNGGFEMVTVVGNAPEFYSFNASNQYFKNSKIRLAFSLGYDREAFVEQLLDGKGEAIYSLMPDIINVGDSPYHNLVNDKNYIIKDLQEKHPDLKALLIEGLIEEGLDPDPANMKVSLATRGTGEISKKMSEWQIQQWKQTLGVNVVIDMMEWNIMWDRIDQGEYDIATAGWGPYYNDPNGLLSIYEPTSGYFNSPKSGWTGPDAEKFSALLEQAGTTVEPNDKAEIYLQAEELLVGTGIISPSYVGTSNDFVAVYIKGYNPSTFGGADYTKIFIAEH